MSCRIRLDTIAAIGVPTTGGGCGSAHPFHMRRTKVSLLYRKTDNLRGCQLLLGHTKLENTVRYLGIEVDDALEL